MKITMKTLLASPERVVQPGQTVDLPRKEAKVLIDAGAAVEAKNDPVRRQERQAAESGDGDGDTSDVDDVLGGFDPADANIDEVQAFVGDDADLAAAVLEAEIEGKNRPTLIEWLEGAGGADDDEERQAAESGDGDGD